MITKQLVISISRVWMNKRTKGLEVPIQVQSNAMCTREHYITFKSLRANLREVG